MPVAVTGDGVAVSYQVRGRGEPLVLLAGQANDHHWWDGVRADFEDRHTTVTLDYGGTGDSDKPDIPYTTRGFAADVVTVLDDLGADRAHVYGTSMGGRVAQWAAPGRQRGTRRLGRAARHHRAHAGPPRHGRRLQPRGQRAPARGPHSRCADASHRRCPARLLRGVPRGRGPHGPGLPGGSLIRGRGPHGPGLPGGSLISRS
nr:alpha/beta hydrolase [Nonomuraea aurantiaca]